jgi:hypothetical protein
MTLKVFPTTVTPLLPALAPVFPPLELPDVAAEPLPVPVPVDEEVEDETKGLLSEEITAVERSKSNCRMLFAACWVII